MTIWKTAPRPRPWLKIPMPCSDLPLQDDRMLLLFLLNPPHFSPPPPPPSLHLRSPQIYPPYTNLPTPSKPPPYIYPPSSIVAIKEKKSNNKNDEPRKPSYNPSALGNLPSAFTHQAPQFLPQQFTDDSVLLIPIPVSALRGATPPSPSASENPTEETSPQQQQQERRSSSSSSKLMNRLRGGGGGKKKEEFKMVEMTRGEYLRYWAKDEEGRYIGTEPEGEGVRRLRGRERGEGGKDLSK